jgi:LacI family transcriptional regulator
MATIYDVARHAGVSPSTVSRVLNGHANVDPELAERVQRATADLGYRRNAVARNLRRNQTTLWAVVIPDIENPFFTALVRGVEDVAQSAGYYVVLCNSDEDLKKEAGYLRAAVAERMAGVIISPASERSTDLAPLLDAETPVVVIDRGVRGFQVDTVQVDNVQASADATKHLLDSGAQRIACITGQRRATTAKQRLQGYERALRKVGRQVESALIRHADFREQGGYDAMALLLDQPNPPDAVFVTNNLMTVGVLECLAARGVGIPGEMLVVGFDEVPWTRLFRPLLSVVKQPIYEVGQTAAHLLLQRIDQPTRPPSKVVLPAKLTTAGSTHRTDQYRTYRSGVRAGVHAPL